MRANSKENPTTDVNHSVSTEVWVSGASANTFGRISKRERAMKKPDEKAQIFPMWLLNLCMKMPAERVTRTAMVADTIMGRVFI